MKEGNFLVSKSANSHSESRFNREILLDSKRSQITIFIILALIIVGAVSGYFLYSSGLIFNNIPKNIEPVYNYYLSCIESNLEQGAALMGFRGGHLAQIDFEPGTEYAPFSNQLDFLGEGIPYWYYISGNGLVKENIPTKSEMEKDLADYLAFNIQNCDFSGFNYEGYNVSFGEARASSSISSDKISTSVTQDIIINYNDETYKVSRHKVEIISSLGRKYDLAKKIYSYEQETLFLENYSRDVLYNYAPVSGEVLNCSPTIWDPNSVFSNLRIALEANIAQINLDSDSSQKNYFSVASDKDFGIRNNEIVNFLYINDWASRLEVWPTENGRMIANPIGTQEGLSSLGFCYSPYKFVYDMYFPVLIRISSEGFEDIFQFPIAVVIDKNVPRESLESNLILEPQESICANANTPFNLGVYDRDFNLINARVSFRCLNDKCYLGETLKNNESLFEASVPQCVNGILILEAEGYKTQNYIISTNEETSADIVMSKVYDLSLEVYVDGKLTNEMASINIEELDVEGNGLGNVLSLNYPYNKDIKLGEGNYNFDIKIFKAGNIQIPEVTTRQCAKVPKAGIFGAVFGLEEDKCTTITVPSQSLTNFVYAGGTGDKYIFESDLEKAKVIRVKVSSEKLPTNAEEMQLVYDRMEVKNIEVELI